MTCIVAICENDKVYMGGDSAASSEHYISYCKNPKVFQNGKYLIGYTSSFRMGQLIEFAELPKPPKKDLYRFMVTEFVTAIREVLSAGGYLRKDCEQEESGDFLVGVRGQLFLVQSDLAVLEYHQDYAACGSGESVALGSLYSTEHDFAFSPKERLLIALDAAALFTTSVSEPFYTYETIS